MSDGNNNDDSSYEASVFWLRLDTSRFFLRLRTYARAEKQNKKCFEPSPSCDLRMSSDPFIVRCAHHFFVKLKRNTTIYNSIPGVIYKPQQTSVLSRPNNGLTDVASIFMWFFSPAVILHPSIQWWLNCLIMRIPKSSLRGIFGWDFWCDFMRRLLCQKKSVRAWAEVVQGCFEHRTYIPFRV